MKKNILIIGNYPPPYGGVPHHIERLTQYLTEKGWNCHVLAGGTSGNKKIGNLHIYKPTYLEKIIALLYQFVNPQFKYWQKSGNLYRDEPKFWTRYKMYSQTGARIIDKHDIQLIVVYNLLSYGPTGAYLADRFRLPLIINIFGEIYKYKSMLKNKSFFEHVLNKADILLSCSKHCGDSIRRLGCDKPVKTIMYGVNVDHFTPGDANNLRARLKIGIQPVVLFVGRLEKEMGLDTFLTMAQRLAPHHPKVQFVMVGQTGDYSEMASKASEISNGQFILSQNAAYSDLPDYYRLASIVVIPTRGERTCSSLAAMEAMATRKAVVGFAVGGIPEIIEHEKTGLLAPSEDVEALIKAVARLLSDEDLQIKLAKSAYKKAEQSFDERRVNEIMESHFISLLKKS